MNKYNEKTQLKAIPEENFTFALKGNAAFADGDEKKKVALRLYDGTVSQHYYWGNFAFDLKGMSLSKTKIPILFQHDVSKRIGVADHASFKGAFDLQGQLFDHSELAQEIIKDSAAGFDFESSLRFDQRNVELHFVKDGESVQVNGNTLKGPGTVILKCEVMEGSICVFAAMKNTRAAMFNLDGIEPNTGIDAFKDSHAELYSEVFAAGKQNERDLFSRILELCEGDNDLAGKCYIEGKTEIETLQAKNAKLSEVIALAGRKKVDPAKTQFIDDSNKLVKTGKLEDGAPETFDAAVDQFMEQEKCNLSEAIRSCVKAYPVLYQQDVELANK